MVTRKAASKTPAKAPARKTTKNAAKTVEAEAPPAVRPRTVRRMSPKATDAAIGAAMPGKIPSGEARYRWIAHAAYLHAERRGFAPGHEIDDWLAAEAEFLAAFGIARD
jgi:hypothetical protein